MAMDDDPIDFGSLDPSRDALGWERRIRATAARAMAARTPSFARQVTAWARPALAIAASMTVVFGALAWSRITAGAAQTDGTQQLVEWAHQGAVPTDADVGSLLGGSDVR